MKASRRAALLIVPALCGLASCGIPATGVVEAGGPAGGVVPTIRVYFVAKGMLAPVTRRVVAPIDAGSAVEVLLQGPTAEERTRGLKSMLPLTAAQPTSVPAVPGRAAPATRVPQAAEATDFAQVTTRGNHVSIELALSSADELPDLAVAQLICTAVAARRAAHPGNDPVTATVAGRDGRRSESTATRCPTE